MSDCTNLEIRDMLPELVRGTLTGPSRVATEEHIATCASCRAELALLQRAYAALSGAPSVDVSRIATAVIRSRAIQRPTVRRAWLAAASVVAIVSAALLASSLVRSPGPRDLPPVVIEFEPDSAPDARQPPEPLESPRPNPRALARAELVVGGGVSELADADLESLLRVLDGLDAQLDVEPAALLPLLEGDV